MNPKGIQTQGDRAWIITDGLTGAGTSTGISYIKYEEATGIIVGIVTGFQIDKGTSACMEYTR